MCIDFLNYYFMMNTSMILEYAFRFKTGKCTFIFLEKYVTMCINYLHAFSMLIE